MWAATAPFHILRQLLAYLEDLTVTTSGAGADKAVLKVEDGFTNLGLRVHPEKSFCHSPAGSCCLVAQATQLWQNAARHDGLVLCGAPLGNGLEMESLADLASLALLGLEYFKCGFVSDIAEKFGEYTRRVDEIPTSCAPGRPRVQRANVFLRQCGIQQVTRLLGTLPLTLKDAFARDIDTHPLRAFEVVNGLLALAQERQIWACLPLAACGMDLANAWELHEAAFHGSWCFAQAASGHVRTAAASLHARLRMDLRECTQAS